VGPDWCSLPPLIPLPVALFDLSLLIPFPVGAYGKYQDCANPPVELTENK